MRVAETLISGKMVNDISQIQADPLIGTILVDAGKIIASDIARIIALQKQKGMRFGEAARTLGLINDDDIQQALSYQFDFPCLSANDQNFSRELISAYQPFSKQAELLRSVREQLMLRWNTDAHKTLALVSPCRGDGRSFIAANLAIVFSQLGERTLLIDADFRQPRQHQLFKLQGGYGLSDVLAGRADLTVVKKIPAFRELSILPVGTVPPNALDLISRGIANCLQQLQTQFDVILIDTPSAEQGIDAQIIASHCGGSLLLARQHKTRMKALQLLKETLQNIGSQCIGVVLTDF